MRLAAVAAFLALAACRDEAPPVPTSEQADQLDEAEAMLNELGEEKGPAANAPGPSKARD